MNLGETTTFEVWGTRYGEPCLLGDGFEKVQHAIEHAELCGHSLYEVVRVTVTRQRVKGGES